MKDNKKIAIVTDGLWRKSLSVIRALGKAGYLVVVMGDSVATTGFWSRYTSRRVIAPVAKTDPEAFGAALIKLIKEQKTKPVLFPMEDDTVIWCANNIKTLEKFAYVALPPKKSLDIAMDKSLTMVQAKRIGIPHPRTWIPETFDEFMNIISSQNHPVVVKPVRASGSIGMVYNTEKSRDEWKSHWEQFAPLIIQQRIPQEGEALGVSLLMNNSKPVLAFAHKRLQQYPNSGGPSTDRVAIQDRKLIQMSTKILESLKWHGVAMVEWKVDPKTNNPLLLEINPRFWGSLELAIRSGLNYPVAYAKLSKNETVEKNRTYHVGTRCRWLIPGEILRYVTQNRSKRESLTKFFHGLPGEAEEWDPSDVAGFISVILCTFVQSFNTKYWKFLLRK